MKDIKIMGRSRSQRIWHLSIAGCLLVGLWLGGCTGTTEISVILPLSGEHQAYGASSRRGIELAFDEWRAANPDNDSVSIEIVDSESDSETAGRLLDAAFERGVFAAIGGVTSPEAASMIPVADRYERVLVSPWGSSADLTRKSAYFYRLAPSDFVAGGKIAEFMSRELSVRDAVVVIDQTALASGAQAGFEAAFEAQRGKLREVLEWTAADDPATLAAKIQQSPPEAVYVAAYEKRLAAFVKALRQRGYDGYILTTQAVAPKASRAVLGANAEGLVFTQPALGVGQDSGTGQRFETAFQEAYGEAPDILAAQSYDALRVLLAAVANAGGLPSKVRDGLRDAVREFPGATGYLQFNDHGEVTLYPRVFQVDKGQVVDYAEKIENEKIKRREEREEVRRRLAALRKEMSSS